MALFKLTDPENDYDELSQVVVRASTELEARQIVADGAFYNGAKFLDDRKTTCEPVPEDGEPEIVVAFVHFG